MLLISPKVIYRLYGWECFMQTSVIGLGFFQRWLMAILSGLQQSSNHERPVHNNSKVLTFPHHNGLRRAIFLRYLIVLCKERGQIRAPPRNASIIKFNKLFGWREWFWYYSGIYWHRSEVKAWEGVDSRIYCKLQRWLWILCRPRSKQLQ